MSLLVDARRHLGLAVYSLALWIEPDIGAALRQHVAQQVEVRTRIRVAEIVVAHQQAMARIAHSN